MRRWKYVNKINPDPFVEVLAKTNKGEIVKAKYKYILPFPLRNEEWYWDWDGKKSDEFIVKWKPLECSHLYKDQVGEMPGLTLVFSTCQRCGKLSFGWIRRK